MRISIKEPNLGFRANGALYRDLIRESLKQPGEVEVDFSNVIVISHSWADECVAKLVIELGNEEFKRVRMLNVSQEVGNTIKEAIVDRLLDLPSQPPRRTTA